MNTSRNVMYVGYLAENQAYQDYFRKLSDTLRQYGCEFEAVSLDKVKDPRTFPLACRNLPKFILPRAAYTFAKRPDDILKWVEIETKGCEDSRDIVKRRLITFSWGFRNILATTRPGLVILGHQYGAMFRMADFICREMGIPVVYVHPGVLPGTICFEAEGQMGLSWVCTDNEAFQELQVEEKDLQLARKWIGRLNRKPIVRPSHYQESGKEERKKLSRISTQGNKIIFYAGSADYLAGVRPRSLSGAEWHSPFLESSDEGLGVLLEQCESHGYHLIYKPHPKNRQVNDRYYVHPRLSIVDTASIYDLIDMCDVCATIVSQVGYEALIRKKAVLLMGRIQLTGKGICYETLQKSDLEQDLFDAVEHGWTESRSQRFEEHVAKLLRYYLFAFDHELSDLGARNVDDAARFLQEYVKRDSPVGSKLGPILLSVLLWLTEKSFLTVCRIKRSLRKRSVAA